MMGASPTLTPPPSSHRSLVAEDAATVVHRKLALDVVVAPPETHTLPSRFGMVFEPQPDDIVGAYRIVRELGAGGMGVVYEAIDQRLKRRVAIKMIRGGVGFSKDAVRRFQTEAEAVAQTQHPNIVQIHEVGWHNGQPYVALEYLPGGSLHARVASKPQSPTEAATLIRLLADAMRHAHAQGVIHRDLKPANILFTADGQPKITDFGAARLTQDGPDSGVIGPALTKVGEVIGTPQYMAPEQARGTPTAVTPAIDVYALGAVLYHMLTGRPPHDGPDSYDVLSSVIQSDPVPPRRLVPKIPRDLETICLKALEKHPAKRYASAAAMADDLGRFLNGESIEARPDSALLRLLKKARRKPLVAGLIAGIIIVACAGLSGVVWQWQHAVANANAAGNANAKAQRAAHQAAIEAANARKETAEKEKSLYRSHVSEVALLLESGDFVKAHTLLAHAAEIEPGKPDPRHWEWHYLNRLGNNFLWMTDLAEDRPGTQFVWAHSMAISPDAKTLAVSGGDPYVGGMFDLGEPATLVFVDIANGTVKRVWEKYLPQAAIQLVWQDAERIVARMPGFGIRTFRVPDGKPISSFREPVGAWRERLCTECSVSPDGRYCWLCTDPRMLAIFDTATGEAVRTVEFDSPILTVTDVNQSAANWRVVVGTLRNGTSVIDPMSGRILLNVPDFKPHDACISADGRQFAIIKDDDRISNTRAVHFENWDLHTGKRLWTSSRPVLSETCAIGFSPDGETIAEVYNASVSLRLYNAATGVKDCELRGHTNRIRQFEFSPDGRHISTASNDGSVRVWSVAAQAEVARLRGHGIGARCVKYDPNGWRLFTAGMDTRAMAWDLTRERIDGSMLPYSSQQGSNDGGAYSGGLWFGTDGVGRYLDTADGSLYFFDPATFTPHRKLYLDGLTRRAEKTATDFALSADAKLLFGPGGIQDGRPHLWDAETGQLIRRFSGFSGNPRINAAAISADGSLAAATMIEIDHVSPPKRQFMIWNTKTGDVLHHETMQGYSYSAMAFDPKRPRLYLGLATMRTKEAGFHIFDLTTKQRGKLPHVKPTLMRHIAVSPDGQWVAGIDFNMEGGPRLLAFDANDTGRGWMKQAVGPATGLAFSPDSRRLALGRFDDALAIYDAASGTEVFSKAMPSSRNGDYAFPARVAFSPDGRSLAMSHSNCQLSVWRTDDWTASPSQRIADRNAEAAGAAYAFHLRSAWELAKDKKSAGFRFHADWLNKLPPPNAFVEREWQTIRMSK